MDIIQYFKQALLNGAGKYAHWVFSLFTVTLLPDSGERKKEDYQFKLYSLKKDNKSYIAFFQEDNIVILTKGNKLLESSLNPPLDYKARLTIEPKDVMDAIDGPLETSAGTLFVNFYCLLYHIGNKLGYLNGKINPKTIEGMIAERIQDLPENGKKDPEALYVEDDERIRSAIASISGFATISAPSATPYTVTVSKETLKLRDELFKKYKDELHDPIRIVEISKEVQKADKEWIQKNDPNAGFYINEEKSFANVRQNLYLFQGMQTRLKDKSMHLVKTSIVDGPSVEDIPALFDTMRAGSYARGAATPLGGEAVKFIFRVFGNVKIIMEDCGSKLGVKRFLNEKTAKRLINHFILVNGQEVLLTQENVSEYMGKFIEMRSPMFCQADTEGRDVCVHCMGPNFREQKQSLGAYCSEPASQMMYVSMKKMHSNVKSTIRINLDETLS